MAARSASDLVKPANQGHRPVTHGGVRQWSTEGCPAVVRGVSVVGRDSPMSSGLWGPWVGVVSVQSGDYWSLVHDSEQVPNRYNTVKQVPTGWS